MAVWGAGFGAIGIYNQSAILRAGKEYREAANGLTVLTIQLGITIGALYGAAALTTFGPLMVPVATALPVVIALVIMVAGRKHAYPPGPKEAGFVAAVAPATAALPAAAAVSARQ
jgi:predicted MFS family arabinose efflux permease